MTYWTPRGDARSLRSVQVAGDELDWIEDRLGPYPFSSLGLVVVDSTSGMETQTMITLGTTEYTLSPAVVVHEMIHQWYGDQVTPRDWRDVWMNEGMAMYLQVLWEATGVRLRRSTTGAVRLGRPRPAGEVVGRPAGELRPGDVRRGKHLLPARPDVGPAAPADR